MESRHAALCIDSSATEFSGMVTGLDSRKMETINDYSVHDLDAPMGPSEIQDVSLNHLCLFWSILDPGPAVPQGSAAFLETACCLHKKMQRPDKCQVHTEVLRRWKMWGNHPILEHP